MHSDHELHNIPTDAARPQPDLYRPWRIPRLIRGELDRTGEAMLTLEAQLHRALRHHDTTGTARRLRECRTRYTHLAAELDEARNASWPLIIIACGRAKRQGLHQVNELYVGSYHRLAKAAALRLTTPERIRVLSAKYGLLQLSDSVESYELQMGQPGSVTTAALAAQAAGLDGRVIILAGRAYAAAALVVFPHAETPLTGTRGIGEQMQLLNRLGH